MNHGMTLDELMQANGLVSTEAQIGMVLNVK
ncbi:LysM peptidoglycan-binding domain-containing protein [uncultured Trichococcus sp.]